MYCTALPAIEEYQKGFEIGKREADIEIAKNLKNMGLDIESIMEITGLTLAGIEKL
ncbi:MAG: hypothetical protein KGV51_07145 [Moraxellaceae bacterium]|nr:hypothetical protein [Moraxellaceae bacterium]